MYIPRRIYNVHVYSCTRVYVCVGVGVCVCVCVCVTQCSLAPHTMQFSTTDGSSGGSLHIPHMC